MKVKPMPRTGVQRLSRFYGMVYALVVLTLLLPSAAALAAAPPPPPPVTGIPALSYSDLADLALTGQLVAGVTDAKAERLKGELAPGLVPGKARFLIQATTGMLLRGADGMPGAVSYIVDVPVDAKGKAPKLKKRRFIVIANRVPGRPLEIRLTSPYSHLDWTQFYESQLRSILTEATAGSAPPHVTGVGNAFYVPGAIPGESESQIFLTTPDNRPISLTILRRPGEQPQWAVALGDMIDENAKAPARNTLLWYRLACFLPARMPGRAIAALSESNANAVREDYKLVMNQLGPCGRAIPR